MENMHVIVHLNTKVCDKRKISPMEVMENAPKKIRDAAITVTLSTISMRQRRPSSSPQGQGELPELFQLANT